MDILRKMRFAHFPQYIHLFYAAKPRDFLTRQDEGAENLFYTEM